MHRLSFGALPLRWKMTLAALIPLMFILLLVAFSAAWLINAWVVDVAQKEVRFDLNAAHEVFRLEQRHISDTVRFSANSKIIATALNSGSLDDTGYELQKIRQREGLDILSLVDPKGKVVLRATAGNVSSTQPSQLPFISSLLNGEAFSGIVLFGQDELMSESPELAGQARISLKGRMDEQHEEVRGMLLVGASPVLGSDGALLGGLYGGTLLNNNLTLVDHIREVVYGETGGSATIFLGVTRVATTIRLDNGERAIGTAVSDEVAEAVLNRGETWLARARVVDDWYLTAYEPILDFLGRPIGALYVGQLEAPFSILKQRASLTLLGLLALGCSSGALLAHYVARRIARPVVELEESARRLASGQRDVHLPEADDDEIGHLARSFQAMTIALRRNEEELNRLNRSLERKVSERTAELDAKNLELMQTQQELLRAEKLAAIGELASGVAHEINNPTAIIRGNVEILRAQLGNGHPAIEEADEILKQTERVSRITQNMLAFAREQTIHPEQVRINGIIKDVLAQVRHQEPVGEVEFLVNLDPGIPPISGDSERLRQVFTNIVVNALQAMKGHGRLGLRSLVEGDAIIVRVEDSGPGIPEDLQEKIFNPFFTTKSNGTGLGLSVSYGIIKAHRGQISVQSLPGDGSTFCIKLPLR